MKRKKIKLILEFILVGLFMGIVEDLIAIFFATDTQMITWKMIGIVFIVTIPFAVFSELIVDKYL